ncbi:MAG: phosphoribosylanthranilate isomerase [Burkholderiales bacterium]|nr:phosphoribosylanthranilate isomerase [Burkholderiales bacterium]
MRTRIKMCGMCSKQDIENACSLGVDAVGFILYPKSKRYVELDALRELVKSVPSFITPVLLFVNPNEELVRQALEIVPNALLQFHGQEPADFCASFKRPWIKAIPINSADSLKEAKRIYGQAQAFLCDTPTQLWGGSGKTFNWQLLSDNSEKIILAGGLTAENVQDAIKALSPYAVDVCSGVEREPRKKDFERMKKFIEQVGLADSAMASRN